MKVRRREISMSKVLHNISSLLLAIAVLLLLTPAVVWASAPARTQTVAAGPYIVDVEFSQDPPYVDQPLNVTVVPHDSALRLSGQVVTQPGLGTDATPLHYTLSSTGDTSNTLAGSIRMPVKGAWNIVVQLSGPQGSGQATIATTVGAPGAMPSWLAWMIGSLPVIGVAVWIVYQHRYRKKLLAMPNA
jgi:hypothetical protein